MPKKSRQRKSATIRAPRGEAPYSRLRTTGPVARREVGALALILTLALAVRMAAFFLNRSNPLFYHPVLDGLFHHEWALQIARGDFWGTEVFFRAPLYPYFLAGLYKISGESITFAVLFQHIIGVAAVALLYFLTREFFNARVARIAGVIAALYWPFVYFEGELLIVSLVVCLDLAMLVAFAKAIHQRSIRHYLVGGVLLGLSAVARPSILVMVPVIPFVAWLQRDPANGQGRVRAWQAQTLAALAGAVLIIMPVIVRNYVVGRDIVPIASQGGVNFYIGNNPQSNGTQAVVPGARADLYGTFQGAIELAEADAGRSLAPSEVSDYYFRKGLSFWIDSTGEALSLTARKLYYFWAGVERSNNKYIQFFWERYGLGRVPFPGFWVVGPLALFGGVLLWPRRRQLALPYLFVVTYMVGVVVFFVNARFRLPVAPVLIMFAAYGIAHLAVVWRTRRAGLAPLLGLLALSTLVVDIDFLKFRGVRAIDEALSFYEIGNAYVKMGRNHQALDAFEKARAIQERYPTRGYQEISAVVDYHLGTLYWEKGLYSRAIVPLERLQSHPEAARATRAVLAECYERTGRLPDSMALYQRVLDESPADKTALLGIVRIATRTGDEETRREAVRQLRERYPRDPDLERQLREIGR